MEPRTQGNKKGGNATERKTDRLTDIIMVLRLGKGREESQQTEPTLLLPDGLGGESGGIEREEERSV